MSTQNKKKIIIILFVIAVIILAANLIYSKLYKVESKKHLEKSGEISLSEIRDRFEKALSNLGIKKEWIKEKKNKNDKALSVSSFTVKIPIDLPITIVLNEVNNLFDKNEALITSEEKKINGAAILKIFSGGSLKLFSELNYESLINRNAGDIGILITGIEKLNDENINTVLSVPVVFTVLLAPSKRSVEIIKKLEDHNKTYAVLLNDKINDLEFRLSEDYSESRLLHSIRTILEKFSKADFYVIDHTSNLFSSSIYPFINKEFNKRNLKLFLEDSLFNISENNEINARENFHEKINKTKEDMRVPIILSAEQLLSFQSEIFDFKKVGYKFINPVKIIKRE